MVFLTQSPGLCSLLKPRDGVIASHEGISISGGSSEKAWEPRLIYKWEAGDTLLSDWGIKHLLNRWLIRRNEMKMGQNPISEEPQLSFLSFCALGMELQVSIWTLFLLSVSIHSVCML